MGVDDVRRAGRSADHWNPETLVHPRSSGGVSADLDFRFEAVSASTANAISLSTGLSTARTRSRPHPGSSGGVRCDCTLDAEYAFTDSHTPDRRMSVHSRTTPIHRLYVGNHDSKNRTNGPSSRAKQDLARGRHARHFNRIGSESACRGISGWYWSRNWHARCTGSFNVKTGRTVE